MSGAFIALTALGLEVSAADRTTCVLVGCGLAVLGGIFFFVPWDRLVPQAMLLAPVCIAGALALLGLRTASAALSFLSLLTLSVVYIGLSQRPGTTLYAMPVIAAVWWLAYPAHPAAVLVRLPLAVVVWATTGEIIAHGTQRAKHRAQELTISAMTDPLTHLGNRRWLEEGLALLAPDSLVMFLDLDHFKAFNDEFGHTAGDDVLMQFAHVLRATVRSSDVIARAGGEEFVILLDPLARGWDVYDRLRLAWEAAGAPVTFSAGAARHHAVSSGMQTVSRADAALYVAKNSGRNMLHIDFSRPALELTSELAVSA